MQVAESLLLRERHHVLRVEVDVLLEDAVWAGLDEAVPIMYTYYNTLYM